jgi:hypothetical protein
MIPQDVQNWKNKTLSKLKQIEQAITPQQFKKLDLDVIVRIITKVTPLIKNNSDFDHFKNQVEFSINFISKENISKKSLKPYRNSLKPIKKWIKEKYQLLPLGFYTLRGLLLGIGVAILYAVGFDTRAGLFIGVAIGFGIGSYLDKKAEKQNKVY